MSGKDLCDAALFDLDGTLLDTTGAILKSLQYTIAHFTGDERPLEFYEKFLGLPLMDVFKELLPEKAEEACGIYVSHNLAIHPQLVKGFPKAKETLLRLKECGIKIGLVTSKRRDNVRIGTKLAGISDLFDVSVCYGETEKPKPNPEPVLRALELLGYLSIDGFKKGSDGPCGPFRKVLMVGDSPFDVRAANNAKTVLAKSGSRISLKSVAAVYGAFPREALARENPDYMIDEIAKVLTICGIVSN